MDSMETARGAASASVTPDGRMIVTGGIEGHYLSSTEVYYNGKWSCGTPIPVARQAHCQVQVGLEAIIIGENVKRISYLLVTL